MTGDQKADEIPSALRHVLSDVDDASAALERARSAVATATAYRRIVIARNNNVEGGESR